MNKKVGETVIYHTTERDRGIMKDYVDCNEREELPAIITAVNSDDSLNLRVIPDGGIHDLWRTSVIKGSEDGEWSEI